MAGPSWVYTRRLIWITVCFLGGFALLCISGWAMVISGSMNDSTRVTVLRWVPIVVGVVTVLLGFYLLHLPVPEDPEDFFLGNDADSELQKMDGK